MKINERTGEIITDKTIYHLTKTEMKIFKKLNPKEITTYEDLYYALYGIKENQLNIETKNGISQIICRIRKKTGIIIENYSGYGFKLGGTNGEI